MSLAPSLVEVSDLETFMRITFDTDSKRDQAELVLQVVSAWARTVGGKNWDTQNPAPDDVVGVVLSAARRELTNPDRVITESMGPLSVTWAKPPEQFFTAGELAILRKKSASGLYTVSTHREEKGWGTGYLYMRGDVSVEPMPVTNYGEPDWEGTYHP